MSMPSSGSIDDILFGELASVRQTTNSAVNAEQMGFSDAEIRGVRARMEVDSYIALVGKLAPDDSTKMRFFCSLFESAPAKSYMEQAAASAIVNLDLAAKDPLPLHGYTGPNDLAGGSLPQRLRQYGYAPQHGFKGRGSLSTNSIISFSSP